MSVIPSQTNGPEGVARPHEPQRLMTVRELCAAFSISPGWVYKRTKEGPLILCLLFASGAVGFASIRPRFPPISALVSGTAPVLRWTHPTELLESAERGITH